MRAGGLPFLCCVAQALDLWVSQRPMLINRQKEEPQYLIKSDKTDHLAMHKGSVLKRIGRQNHDSKVRRLYGAVMRARKSQG